MEDLINFLFQNRSGKKEDVAADVLALLLEQSPGQALIGRYLRDGDLHTQYLVQKRLRHTIQEDGAIVICHPDIQISKSGNIVAIIELKFAADLTRAQRQGSYLKLAREIIFVVPAEREQEVREIFSQGFLPEPTIMSWASLLHDLQEQDACIGGVPLYLHTIEQLRSFCKVIACERFEPFTNVTCASPTGDPNFAHCKWLLENVVIDASKAGLLSGVTRGSFGGRAEVFFGMECSIGGRQCWLGYWPTAWKKHRFSGPLWLSFWGRTATELRNNATFKNAVRVDENDLAIPLLPSERASAGSQEEELQFLLTRLQEVASALLLSPPATNLSLSE